MARPGLTRHRKFARLARLLGSSVLAIGHLELLWNVAYENGDDLLGDAGDLEFMAGWTGEAGKLAAMLLEAGFVDKDEDGCFKVHDLWDHAPDYVRKRQNREAERRVKGDKLRSVSAERQSVTGQCPPNGAERQSVSAERRETAPNGRTPAPAPAPAPAEDSAAADAPPAAEVTATPSKKPTDPRHKAATDLLVATWLEVVGTVYRFQGGRDGQAVKTLLGYAEATDEEIAGRYRAYLSDPFNVKQASLAHFVSKWSACAPPRATAKAIDWTKGRAPVETINWEGRTTW